MDQLAAVLAFIASADYFALLRIQNALNRVKRSDEGKPVITPAQAKSTFKPGTYAEIGNTTNEALNGSIVKVESVDGKLVTYTLGEQRGRVPYICMAPVDASEAQAQLSGQKPVASVGSAVRLADRGKYGGSIGVIVRKGKSSFSAVITEGEYAGQILKGGHLLFEALPTPPKNPNLLVFFKNESAGRDPVGPVTIIDTTKSDPTKLRPFGEKVESEISVFDWLKYSEAQALARGLGAKIESA